MAFTTAPRLQDMVTQPCIRACCTDVLCVTCGWEGHVEIEAPETVFESHQCKMRVADKVGRDF